ncbi:hypothetical protein N7495_001636 [Penicillium taxi]|uniref:uncharacterized protein n=1 Tax=Penicillium taxi TaxID=168475 RepID=UPI00254528E9|nr:uncharacterized protein N7495_001636 [Penicillium taxi]KAJ5908954.1 hypothetical protein N7495_001636 [Penicillium taxi]
MGQAVQPGKIVMLDSPLPSKWKIVEVLNEHESRYQKDEKSISYASLKLRCTRVLKKSQEAMIRVIIQISHKYTELEDATTRAKQAKPFTPLELTAYKTLADNHSAITPQLLGYKEGRQEPSGIIPGGFITWIAWAVIPGFQLSDGSSSSAKIYEMGMHCEPFGNQNLLWYPKIMKLSWVGFREWRKFEKPLLWHDIWYVIFDLMKLEELGPEWLLQVTARL